MRPLLCALYESTMCPPCTLYASTMLQARVLSDVMMRPRSSTLGLPSAIPILNWLPVVL